MAPLITFISEVYTACEVVTQRVEAGQEWFGNYESMCLSLSKVRSNLPKVQLAITDKSELIDESKNLVRFCEQFWGQFEVWIKKRVNSYVSEGQHGITVVRRFMPDCHEQENMTFVDIRNTVRNKCMLTSFCYVTTQLINPESVDTLCDIWKDINGILTKISSLKTTVEDRHGRGVMILLDDIKQTLDVIAAERSNFDVGSRRD